MIQFLKETRAETRERLKTHIWARDCDKGLKKGQRDEEEVAKGQRRKEAKGREE
jgi:hypothetical protein